MRQVYIKVVKPGPLLTNLEKPGLTLQPTCFMNLDGKQNLSIIPQTRKITGNSYWKAQEVHE